MNTKPKGYFEKILVVDFETSGIALGCDDASYNPSTGATYQAVSVGLIVVNAQTLKPIDELYVEIKWDGVSTWNDRAQEVHGLSREYLEANGMSTSDAVIEVADLILNHWGPTGNVVLMGHNVATFDLWFLKRLLRSEGIEVRFSNRTLDSNGLGFSVFSTYNSDDLFEQIGCVRDPTKHNALEDAKQSLQVFRMVRTLSNQMLEG